MRILMLTNTYLPHVGGVARSVASFAEDYRQAGHQVLIVAPTFPGQPAGETEVLRVPAIQRFNGSDFSVRIPVPGLLSDKLDRFRPDIVHSHHPFLLGDAALRYATSRGLPLIFTHHTMYERYTHYVPSDLAAIKPFVISLATEYANLCDRVIAPSESVMAVLAARGVRAPIAVVPTGIDRVRFSKGDGRGLRSRFRIPADAWVVGHVGRLAPEKSLGFLAAGTIPFLRAAGGRHLLVVGSGPAQEEMAAAFASHRLAHRVHFTGALQEQELIDAYHAMDVFAFASRSETQGMVIAEAMAAGLPVVALEAPGVREIVRDGRNGRLLTQETAASFSDALEWVAAGTPAARLQLREEALLTARAYDRKACARRALRVYEEARAGRRPRTTSEDSHWMHAMRRIETEWHLWQVRAEAAVQALRESRRTAVAAEKQGLQR